MSTSHPFTESDRIKEKKDALEQASHVPQRAETWKLSIQTANLGDVVLYLVNITILSKTEKIDEPDPLVGFESFKHIPTIEELYTIICRASVFPMNRGIINGRPLYLIIDDEISEKSLDEASLNKIKEEIVAPFKKLGIKIVKEIPKEENGTFLICNHCSNPLLKIFRCSRCKAVNYCQRQCQVNDWQFHKFYCKQMQAHVEHAKSQVEELSYIPYLNLKSLDEHLIFPEMYTKEEIEASVNSENDSSSVKIKTKVGGLWAIPQILDGTFTVSHRLAMTGLPYNGIPKESTEENKEKPEEESELKTEENVQEDENNKNDEVKSEEENKTENENDNNIKEKVDKYYENHGDLNDGFPEEFLPWIKHFSLESGFQNSPKVISCWKDYFKAKASDFYPAALLLTTPLSIFYILNKITPQFRDLPKKLSLASGTNLCIHIVNPSQTNIEVLELYQCLLPLIRNVTLDIFFIGPEMAALPLSKQPYEEYMTQTVLAKRRDLSIEFKSETFESCIRLHLARTNYSSFPIDKYPADVVICIDATKNLFSHNITVEVKNENDKKEKNENEDKEKMEEDKKEEGEEENKKEEDIKPKETKTMNLFQYEVIDPIRTKTGKTVESTVCMVIESSETECEIGKHILRHSCNIRFPASTSAIQLNPFRQPWLSRYPNINVPKWTNGFIYGFKV
ncbi:hypothetical protein BCR36DRAFT_363851 [Piromyces finnis]|uniref:MYND-type domain-containing protein n=1 Tax=Piromyces finnis TaxID=1754191 RepID=A0A1Y1UWN9_9FUNG|nr:hypothetical protein BCR36DRAFT_363851 [Piromyces finnis]|eukprot:ORX41631.1 hypothetical protein BCR36DRAFT_363851 [Piromyces finnis]